MQSDTSKVYADVDPAIKKQAESILSKLGISADSGINMFYRQIIIWNGLPFRPALANRRPVALNEMSKEEFDSKMSRGLKQAESGEGMEADVFFDSLRKEIEDYV
ncbi:MAG: type II toxin-antitoxin system RelB/DinJ family antitoxin [Elusimicrobiales bacterium]|nr:type II toxin-antitoxin system RelB/DinJ family antitoxin [Elusimicrobiales bacterium]